MWYRLRCAAYVFLVSNVAAAATPDFTAYTPATGAAVQVVLEHRERYLIVCDPNMSPPTYYYARRPHFTYTADGHFVTREGMVLQGYSPGTNLERQGPIGDIQGPPLVALEAPQPTSTIAIQGNLDLHGACEAFDQGMATRTSSAHARVAAYDEHGSKHLLTLYFSRCATYRSSPNDYERSYALNVMEGRQWLGEANLYFDTAGRLAQINQDHTAHITLKAGLGSQQVIALDLGDPIDIQGNSGQRGITCYKSATQLKHIRADGHAAGLLARIQVIDDFTLAGKTTTGATRFLGTLVTASFSSETHLTPIAPTIYQRRADGGDDLTQVLEARYEGEASSTLTVTGNLPFGTSNDEFDPARPEASNTAWATTQIFSDDARAWDLTLFFAREIHAERARGYPIRYQYAAVVALADGQQAPQSAGSGTLYFDRHGHLGQINSGGRPLLDLEHTRGWARPVALQFEGITVYDAPARLRLQSDGTSRGLLTALRIRATGEVEGDFTNYFTRPLGPLNAVETARENKHARARRPRK